MIAYLDASSLTALIVRDPGWAIIKTLVAEQATEVNLSDFGWGEFVSALALRVRRGAATSEEAHRVIAEAPLLVGGWRKREIISADITAGTELVARFDLKLRLPDAIHVAIAQRLEATLVTGDKRQAAAAEALGAAVFNPLAGVAS